MLYSRRSRMLFIAAIHVLSVAGCGSLRNAPDLQAKSSPPEAKILHDSIEAIPAVKPRLTKLVFFGSGPSDIAPIKNPTYKARFEHATTTQVHPEIHLDYRAPGKKVYFTMTVHIRENGRTFRIVDHESRIEPDWTSSYHSIGIGVFGPGTWPIGTYEAEIYINGDKVATGYFEVY
jgi:hypothetical protein